MKKRLALLTLTALVLGAATGWLDARSRTSSEVADQGSLAAATAELERARIDVTRTSLDAITARAGAFAGVVDAASLERVEEQRRTAWSAAASLAGVVAETQPTLQPDAERLSNAVSEPDPIAASSLFEAAGIAQYEVLDRPSATAVDELAFVDNAFTLVLYEAFLAEADRAGESPDLVAPEDIDFLREDILFVSEAAGYLGPDPGRPLDNSWFFFDTDSYSADEFSRLDQANDLMVGSDIWAIEQSTIAWADGANEPAPIPLADAFIETAQNVATLRSVIDGDLAAAVDASLSSATTARSEARQARIGSFISGALLLGVVLLLVGDGVRAIRRVGAIASVDELTQVGNRRRLDAVRAHLADRSFDHHAAAMIDLDRFKLVNDTYGHLVGDRVLVEVARQLETAAQAAATQQHEVIRLGGDEFFVTFHDDQPITIASIERQLEAIQANTVTTSDGDGIALEFSFGIAEAAGSSAALEELLDAADLRAYQDKQRRRDNRATEQAATFDTRALDTPAVDLRS